MTCGMRLGLVFVIARQELRTLLRNKWVATYAAVFGLLSLAVSYFGLTVIEFTGFQSFQRTAVSLLNLVLYIVPLGAMLMAVQSFRPEGGLTDQLFAEPVSESEIVVGKILGLSIGYSLATLVGFGMTGILVGSRAGIRGAEHYFVLLAFTLLVGFAFLSLSTWLTVLSRRDNIAYAIVLVVWFFAVILFDLLVIGVSFLLPELWANRVALGAVFVNPIDAARVATLLSIAGREMFGSAGAQLVRDLGGTSWAITVLIGTLAAWISVPLLLAVRCLRRQDL